MQRHGQLQSGEQRTLFGGVLRHQIRERSSQQELHGY
jgi:hypothetical protein